LYQPGVFWHREILESIPSFDTALHFVFDHEYWARCLVRGYRPVNISTPIANFRIHKQSKTSCSQHLFMKELWQIAGTYGASLSSESYLEMKLHLDNYEASYLIDAVYSLLLQGERLAALEYLLKSFRLVSKLPTRKLYIGALLRILFRGKPPAWFNAP
jgi:hypothetical protein